MNFFVYILQSVKTNRYYVGQTENPELRLEQHNSDENDHFTFRDKPWVLKITIECKSRRQAMMLESFIKRQKSKTFIEKIIADEKVRQSLIQKFEDC